MLALNRIVMAGIDSTIEWTRKLTRLKSRGYLKVDSLVPQDSGIVRYIRIKDQDYFILLGFTRYMGKQAGPYYDLTEKLRHSRDRHYADKYLEQIRKMNIPNKYLKDSLHNVLDSLEII
jgi:hypothetical protein